MQQSHVPETHADRQVLASQYYIGDSPREEHAAHARASTDPWHPSLPQPTRMERPPTHNWRPPLQRHRPSVVSAAQTADVRPPLQRRRPHNTATLPEGNQRNHPHGQLHDQRQHSTTSIANETTQWHEARAEEEAIHQLIDCAEASALTQAHHLHLTANPIDPGPQTHTDTTEADQPPQAAHHTPLSTAEQQLSPNSIQCLLTEVQQWMESMHTQMLALTHKVHGQDQLIQSLQHEAIQHAEHNCAILTTQQEHHSAVYELQTRFEDIQLTLVSSLHKQDAQNADQESAQTQLNEDILPDATTDAYMQETEQNPAVDHQQQGTHVARLLSPVQAAFRAFRQQRRTATPATPATPEPQVTCPANTKLRGRPRKVTQASRTNTSVGTDIKPATASNAAHGAQQFGLIDDDIEDEIPSSEQDEETNAALRSLKSDS
eukprot:4046687-Amphidinium_carterae.2